MGLFNLCWIMRRLNRYFVIGRDLVTPLLHATQIAEIAEANCRPDASGLLRPDRA